MSFFDRDVRPTLVTTVATAAAIVPVTDMLIRQQAGLIVITSLWVASSPLIVSFSYQPNSCGGRHRWWHCRGSARDGWPRFFVLGQDSPNPDPKAW